MKGPRVNIIYLTLSVLCILCSSETAAQSNADISGASLINRQDIAPTPSSAVFRKYMSGGPALLTGAANIDIPIYEISYKGFSLPVSLRYLSNGIKVFDSPYPCGYGWSLHPGLRITREIIGRPDELFENVCNDLNSSYIDYEHARKCQISADMPSVGEQVYDSGHDIFYIYLPTESYVRILENNNGSLSFVGADSELKISASPNLSRITVVDSEGIEYVFGDEVEYSLLPQFITTWTLKEIRLPFGNKIEFKWKTIDNLVNHRRYDMAIALNDCLTIDQGLTSIDTYQYLDVVSNRPYIDSHPYCLSLESITWPGGKINCTYSNYSTIGCLLSEISVLSKSGETVKTCNLAYGSSRRRLLERIKLSDEGSYYFQYDSHDFASDNAQDWWGYYNGKTTNTSLIPRAKMKIYNRSSGTPGVWSQQFGDADRSADADAMKANILTKVIYPTGGYSTFEYEPHSFDPPQIACEELDSAYFDRFTSGGGLRLKSISTYAGEGMGAIVKSFKYGKNESGKARCRTAPTLPTFFESVITPSVDYNVSSGMSMPSNSFDYRRTTVSAFSNYNDFSFGENEIWYEQVTEYSDDGKTVYEFYEPVAANSYTPCPYTDREFFSRQPLAITSIGSPGPVLKKKTEYIKSGNQYISRLCVEHTHQSVCQLDPVWNYHLRYRIKNTVTDTAPDFPQVALGSNSFAQTQFGNFTISWDYNNMYAPRHYSMKIYACATTRIKRTTYTENGSATELKYLGYVPNTTILRSIDTTDGTETRRQEFIYAPQKTDSRLVMCDSIGQTMDAMVSMNWISVPVAVVSTEGGRTVTRQNIYSITDSISPRRDFVLSRVILRVSGYDTDTLTLASFRYDSVGNVSEIRSPGKPVTKLAWDNKGIHVVSETLSPGSTIIGDSPSLITYYNYNNRDLLSSTTDPAGLIHIYTYNARNALSEVGINSYGPIYTYDYGYLPDYNYVPSVSSISLTRNYVKEHKALNATTGQKASSCTYYDGIGRPWQTVKEGTGAIKSIISAVEYDSSGREKRIWQPVSSTAISLPSLTDISNTSQSVYGAYCAYTDMEYSGRSLDAPFYTVRPGTIFRQTGTKIFSRLYVNGSGLYNCASFAVNASGALVRSGNRQAGTLLVSSVTDEDGRQRLTFTNLFGQKILERSVISSGQYADTYYIYDSLGRLRYMLSPEASAEICASSSGTWTTAHPAVGELAYYYEYDASGTLTMKKLPGCDPVIYLCDKEHQPVLSQDGNQRARNAWTYTLRDALKRPCLQGEVVLTEQKAREFVRKVPTVFRQNSAQSTYCYNWLRNLNLDPVNADNVDVAYLYDDYDFLDAQPANVASDMAYQLSLGAERHISALGRMTGMFVSGRLSVSYYDLPGRVIQSHSRNASGGTDTRRTVYNYTGQPLSLTHTHRISGKTYTEKYTYTYDALSRLVSTKLGINNQAPVTISQITYDDLGHPGTVTLSDGQLPVSYTYDMQGRVSEISSDVFCENIVYESSSGSKSGNVNASSWSYGSASTQAGSMSYVYDSLDRLVCAKSPSGGASLAEYTYDRNCNPTRLRRYGIIDIIGGTPLHEEIDNVVFSYSGNRVTTATDSHEALIYSGANDFTSGSSQYTWDANGNLVSDSGKGVVSVAYNRFNLPVAVDLGDRGDISFTYDGLGRKLSMSSRPKLTINPLAKSAPKEIEGGKIDGDFPVADIDFFSRFYYDNLIFKGTQLERILFPGGYITPSGTEYIYHYYVTDRQGNARAVVRDGNLVEANDYYPYGMLMADADGKIPDKQPYKLSGKEYITTRGLNLYDFGARMHDPAAMRFYTPDPLMEQYPSLSPYTYCAANPMKYIDPTGMTTYVIDQDGHLILKDETKEDDTVIVEDEDGIEIGSISLGKNIIEKFFRNYYDVGPSNTIRYRGVFECYRIRGDNNAKNLFYLLASYTNVEWSMALTGDKANGLAFLTTSFKNNFDGGMPYLYMHQLRYSYFLREFYHNHNSIDGSDVTSDSDLRLANTIINNYKELGLYNNSISFGLLVPTLGYKYIIYYK